MISTKYHSKYSDGNVLHIPNTDVDEVTIMKIQCRLNMAYMSGGMGDGGRYPRDNIAMSYLLKI